MPNKILLFIISLMAIVGLSSCSGIPNTNTTISEENSHMADVTTAPSDSTGSLRSDNEVSEQLQSSTASETTSTRSEDSSSEDSSSIVSSDSISEANSASVSINRENISEFDALIFYKFVTPDEGQKTITDPIEIQKILDYISSAKKTSVPSQSIPGTVLSIKCKNADYVATLYYGNILFYNGKYYKTDNNFRHALLALYDEAPGTASKLNVTSGS